jgi:hypothetical protein
MKIIVYGFLIFILIVFMTYDYQNKIVDTRLLGIPEKCLDANGDGIYDSDDFNYSGYNGFFKPKEIMLIDAKGAASITKSCEGLDSNPYRNYIEITCRLSCRLRGFYDIRMGGK